MKEIELTEYGKLVFKHKTNKRLFLERTYRWIDNMVLLDETESRQIIDSFKYSTFDFGAWTPMTKEEYDSVKACYKEIYGYEKNIMKNDSEDTTFNELKKFKLDETTNRRLIYKTQPLNSNDTLSKDKKTQITQIYGQTNWNNKKETFDGKVKLN